jgi:GTP-binding protein EngB required for normal cell division
MVPVALADQTVADLLTLMSDVTDACLAAGRDDLAEQVASRRALVVDPAVAVVVAGEYKVGKSSLVNALIGTDLCPVDEDVATAVPIIVRHAAEAHLWVRRQPEELPDATPQDDPEPEQVPVAALATLASEKTNPDNRERVRSLEVGLPAPRLADGLVLVDTPGVGGLVSQNMVATLASLSMAHAAVFVSDATQEYTAPELEFLEAARRACPQVVPVLTKVDIAPAWEKIRDLDQQWLAHVGVTETIVTASSALSKQGRVGQRSDLEEESGVRALVERLEQVVRDGRRSAAADAATQVHAVISQLAAPVNAERDALHDPWKVIAELEQAEQRAGRLASDTAQWLLLLDDGLRDIEDRIEVEVETRIREIRSEAERSLAKIDPAAKWDQFEAELARQVSNEMSAISAILLEGAHEVADRIAEHFAGHEAAIAPAFQTDAPGLTAEAILATGTAKTQWRGVLMEAGWSGLEGLAAIGSILTFTTISLFNPFSLAVGLFIGGKSLHQARHRELQRRRQQALEAVDRYLADAARATDREWRSSLRRIRRELRVAYQERADTLYRSARESLAAARRTGVANEADRAARQASLAADLDSLQALDRRAGQLATALSGSGA